MVRAHALLALATLLLIGPTLGCGVMLYDEGELLLFADSIRQGLVPGRDFVVNGYGPGRYLLLAPLLGLAPPLAVTDAVFFALRLGISSLAWLVARRIVPERAWVLPAALLVAPGPLHKGFFLLGTLAIALALLRWLQAPSARRAAVLGAVVAAAGLFRLDLGLFGVALGGLALVARHPRQLPLLLAGPAAAAAAVLGWMLLDGSTAAVVAQVLDDVAKNQTIAEPRYPGPARIADPEAWLLWAPLLIYPAFALRLRDQPPERRRALLVVLLLGVLTANQVRMKPELGHLLQAGPMLWLAAIVLLRRAAPLLLVPLALAALIRPGDVYTGAWTIPLDRTHRVQTAAGPVRLNPGERQELEPLLAHLQRLPPGPVWVPSNEPLLHALSGRGDADGRVGVVYYVGSEAAQRDVVARVEAVRPPAAVFVDSSIEGPERSVRVGAPLVDAHLRRTYAPVATYGRFVLMQRR